MEHESLLTHPFKDPALLEEALTHSSKSARHNERLEFLGDAVLDLFIAEALYLGRPDLDEGDLTKRKATVVARRTLAAAADRAGLTPLLRLGRGLWRDQASMAVRAGLFEAVVGALYLDGGPDAARPFVLLALASPLEAAFSDSQVVVPKQALQEFAQKAGLGLPTYERLQSEGLAHAPRFCVRACLGGRAFEEAWGSTLKEAESRAAEHALDVLSKEGSGE